MTLRDLARLYWRTRWTGAVIIAVGPVTYIAALIACGLFKEFFA